MVSVYSAVKKIIVVVGTSCMILTAADHPFKEVVTEDSQPPQAEPLQKIEIKKIIVEGNKYVKTETILHRLPYKVGEHFDRLKTAKAIKNLYQLGSFKQVELQTEDANEQAVNLYVIVVERPLLAHTDITGNKHLETKKIEEKLGIDKLTTIDEEVAAHLARDIEKLYQDEQRHSAYVAWKLITDKKNPDKQTLKLLIDEGPRSILKRVHFKGCKQLPERKLRNITLSREEWLLKFLDSAGVYKQEFVDMDKLRIEYFYRDHGYLNAKVVKTDVTFSKDKKRVDVTFHIKEGPQFIVQSIKVPGDELFSEDELLPLISLEIGKPYVQKKLIMSMEKLKERWGIEGYIYADVYPQMKIDADTKTVDIVFHVERGKKMYANRINITGNQSTRDKVIRRQLDIIEGDLITTPKLNASRNHVEYLGFFERDGVNWQIHRLTDSLADLELNVKEAKTGNVNFMLTYGSDRLNPKRDLRASIMLSKNNLLGLGYDVGLMLQADRHHLPQKIEFHFTDPHIWDSNISGAYNFYRRVDEFEGWANVSPSPIQEVLGANFRFGFGLPLIDKHLQAVAGIALEKVHNNDPHAIGPQADIFENVVRREFQKGGVTTLSFELIKDTRNHPVYPCEGYKMSLGCFIAPPIFNHHFSFIKTDVEGSSYTGLIGRDSLVLGLHGMLGMAHELDGKNIPYKDLFIMGGQTTVRGFIWGGVGPAWTTGEPLGARNAMLFKAELIFPLAQDYGMKGHVFYDAGAGWDTPKHSATEMQYVRRDCFDLRHSIGFGINLTRPMPAKIDWGFKLDRRKDLGESAQEFHLGMNYAF